MIIKPDYVKGFKKYIKMSGNLLKTALLTFVRMAKVK